MTADCGVMAMAGTGECEEGAPDITYEVTSLRLRAAKKSLEAATLREALRRSQVERDLAKAQLGAAEAKVQKASDDADEAQQLSSDISRLRKELADANFELAKVRRETIALQRKENPEAAEMQRVLQHCHSQNAELNAERQHLVIRLSTAQKEHAQLCQDVAALCKERDMLAAQAKATHSVTATARFAKAESKIAELKAATERLEQEGRTLAASRDAAEVKIKECEESEQQLQQELASLGLAKQDALTKCKEDCESKLEQLRASLAENREAACDADQIAAAALSELEAWQKLHADSEAEAKQLATDCERAAKQERDAKRQADRLQQELSAVEAQLESLRQEQQEVLAQADKLRLSYMMPAAVAAIISMAATFVHSKAQKLRATEEKSLTA
eukprot:TRINITY_DN43366_c0_g1_i1.p1 TRINITY_DN43366_c0_g1~~TRINITY_DN43366_c0_g1_i1.p1  ORF type:complete len:390 (-),score=127.23 TRINITY_DN43366_c0_g1_i1:88-1257(-)